MPHTTPLCKEGYCVCLGAFPFLQHFSFNLPLTSSPDVDECRRSPRPCAGGRCENSVGSFSCRCRAGYQADPSGAECHGMFRMRPSPPWNPLSKRCAKTPPPCANGRCYNTPGSFSCSCPSGYQLDPNQCLDIDECSTGTPCGPQGRCFNTEGSFRCQCNRGYRTEGTGSSCVGEC
uniref:EGF-like domain-containing protein n=1 Tax=Anolis carolinensis TaxID=28377 RepID=A0A803TP54_ANOCA